MTTFIVHTAPSAKNEPGDDDDLDAFMSELNTALRPAPRERRHAHARQAALASPDAAATHAALEILWHPRSVALVQEYTTCACGATYNAPLGLFLVAQTRQGATRHTRQANAIIPPEFQALPRRVETEYVGVPICPACLQNQQLPTTNQEHTHVNTTSY